MNTQPMSAVCVFFVALLLVAGGGDSCQGERVKSAFGEIKQVVDDSGWEEQVVVRSVAERLDAMDIQFDPYAWETTSELNRGNFVPSWSQQQPIPIWRKIGRDYTNFYRHNALIHLGAGFGIGAVMANTNIDNELQDRFQRSVHNANSDDWLEFFHANKELGNPAYTIPIVTASWIVGDLLQDYSPVFEATGAWGERSLRGYLVGIPHTLLFQQLTGGSRPGERNSDSAWRPFSDDNGVSGHSFVSALPFITAAKMTDRPFLKGVFYTASTLGPLSRINDNAHYPSQALLGWWVAWASASAVARTEAEIGSWRVMPYANGQSTGLAAEYNW